MATFNTIGRRSSCLALGVAISVVPAFALLITVGSTHSSAQNANTVFNLFNNMMRAAIAERSRAEWNKIPPTEVVCLRQGLQQQGQSIDYLIEHGLLPSDPRLSNLRLGCRTALAPLQPPALAFPTEPSGYAQRLSDRPTYDCTIAKSPSGRILCLDQEGARVDWDFNSAYRARSFSLPDAARDKFEQEHENWPATLLRSCKLRTGQADFSDVQRQCVLNSFRKRTAFYRSRLTGDALAESQLSPEQHAEIQQALISLGLLRGDADGEFGEQTRAAIKQFQAQSGFPESGFLTTDQRRALVQSTRTAQAVSRDNGQPPLTRPEDNTSIKPQLQLAQPPPPPKDTVRLKEARAFLDDARKFISIQTDVPSIAAIANEAANLDIALIKFDEAGAIVSMRRLNDLLKSLNGFEEFVKERQVERQRENSRQLADATNEASKNTYFIDNYLKANLGDAKTASLIKLRQQIDNSIKQQAIDEIKAATDALQSFVADNDLSNSYQAIVRTFLTPAVPGPPPNPESYEKRLGLNDKSRIIADGAIDDIVLLYNASPTAPNVWKNVRGDVAFQHETAALCFSQSKPSIVLARYVERLLAQEGARNVLSEQQPCDLSKVEASIDIVAFQRGEILRQRDNYIVALAKLIESDIFRKYRIVTDYGSELQKREVLALQLESDVEASARKGYGVIKVSDTPTACVVAPTQVELVDGIEGLLARERDLIAPSLNSDWKFVQTTADLAFLGLQRQQCGYVAADAAVLQALMQALRRENLKYAFSPVWFDPKDVAQEAFDARDKREQENRKREEENRKQKAEEDIESERAMKKESQKSEIERQLRQKNGVRARGLMNEINEFVKALAEKRAVDKDRRFSNYSKWLDQRFDNQWETFEITSEVSDFGTVQWNGRPLDAIVVQSVVQQKNRWLGQYQRDCFMFGLVDDAEFMMQRALFSVPCDNPEFVKTWKAGNKFQSQWNAD